MNNEILDKLNKEIGDHLDELSKKECGTEEMRKQINDLETLYELRLKELEVQEKAKENQLKNELEMDRHVVDADNKAEQLKEQKKDRRTKTALAIGKALGLAGAFFIGMRFEESGAICSKTVGKVIDKMIK
jgi:TolA-binding protein